MKKESNKVIGFKR